MFIWRNVGPAGRMAPPSKEGDPVKQVTLLAEPTFRLSCKRFVSFVRKCRKSWLAKGRLGRRVTLFPGTTFLKQGLRKKQNVFGLRVLSPGVKSVNSA